MKNLSVDNLMEYEMNQRLALIRKFMDIFQTEYHVPIHVKDFSGYMTAHPLLGEFTQSYLFHENSFCSYVKSHPKAMEMCVITSNDLLMKKLNIDRQKTRDNFVNNMSMNSLSGKEYRTNGFYGSCWCGIREYVCPIYHSGIVIGAVLVGTFGSEQKVCDHSIARLSLSYGHSSKELRQLYDSVTEKVSTLPCTAELQIDLLANYLSMLTEYYIHYPLVAAFHEACLGKTRRHKLISCAIDYITQNLPQKILVADIAVYCMCSKSTLNHLFRQAMGCTIPEFVSLQRVNRAKYMLLNTSFSMEQISTECGFSSSNYFSVTFKRLTNVTPTDYRNHVIGQNSENIVGVL